MRFFFDTVDMVGDVGRRGAGARPSLARAEGQRWLPNVTIKTLIWIERSDEDWWSLPTDSEAIDCWYGKVRVSLGKRS
jgi:hypothetical protein